MRTQSQNPFATRAVPPGVLSAIQVAVLATLTVWAPATAQPRPPSVDTLLARLDDLYRSKSSIARVEIRPRRGRSATDGRPW
jgi:hypothetical protein